MGNMFNKDEEDSEAEYGRHQGSSGFCDRFCSKTPDTPFTQWANTTYERIDSATTFVMGNDGADSDSIICAIVYGYLWEVTHPGKTCIPVVQCSLEDMALRRETQLLLEKNGIDYEELVYYDDVVHAKILGGAEVVLTDHNVLGGRLTGQESKLKVVHVIDHHKFEEKFKKDIVNIESSCSCTILVSEELRKYGDALDPEDVPVLQDLCRGVTLLDTDGLTKSTDYDNAHLPEIGGAEPTEEEVQFHKTLKKLRANEDFWADPDVGLLLRYDTKISQAFSDGRDKRQVAASKCKVADMPGLVQRKDFLPAVQSYMREHGVQLLRLSGKDELQVIFAAEPDQKVDFGPMIKSHQEDCKNAICKEVSSGNTPLNWKFYVKDEEAMAKLPPQPAEEKKHRDFSKNKKAGRGMVDLDGWS